MSKICFNRALEVLGTNKVVVPGCEPTSAMSSDVLNRFLDCGCAVVPLAAALEAIPGSFVRFGLNTGGGIRTRWFVLPPECKTCPCTGDPDYYKILRNLCEGPEEPPPEECELIWPVDVCVPDLTIDNIDDIAARSPVNYIEEGGDQIVNNLWKSSPWYLQQVSKAKAAGLPITSLSQPIQPNNKETVIDDGGDFSGLASILGNT